MNFECGKYPNIRMRRKRYTPWLRQLLSETNLQPKDLILPLFIREGKNETHTISSLPGVYSVSIDIAINIIKEAKDLGISAVAIFPVVDMQHKTDNAYEAYNQDNLICRAVREIKSHIDGIGIICDVALDPYTSHGHDGLLINGYVDNDRTIEVLCKQSLTLANAGCDIIAPSDMMDGRVGQIRKALDENNFINLAILSYAVKYASSLYAPFRDAVGSKVNLNNGDKKTYQMDIRNSNESLSEALLDINEGADILMVKPASLYLDIIYRIKQEYKFPTFAYQVSGEYSQIKAASINGWLDYEKVMYESLIAIKRAGADAILTYAAIEMAKLIND